MSLNPWLMLLLGIVLGWLAAWFFSRNLPTNADEEPAYEARPRASGMEAGRPPADSATLSGAPAAGEWRSTDAGSSDGAPAFTETAVEPESATVYEASTAPASTETRRSPAAAAADDPQTSAEVWLGAGADSADDAPAPVETEPLVETDQGAGWGGGAVQTGGPAAAGLQAGGLAQGEIVQGEIVQDDDLTQIVGIGPTYGGRLRAAGITTFAQLAEMDEAALGELIAAPDWRKVDYGDWIAQARRAASGDRSGLQTT